MAEKKTTTKTPPARKRASKVVAAPARRDEHGNGQHIVDTLEELIAAASTVGDRTAGLEDTLVESMHKEHTDDRRVIKYLIAVVFFLGLLVGLQNARSIWVSGPILSRLDHQTQGVDKLVSFVDQVKQSTCDPKSPPAGGCPPGETEVLLKNFIAIDCASSDPGQQDVCRKLGYTTITGGK